MLICWFAAQETFFIIVNVENIVLLHIFLILFLIFFAHIFKETTMHVFFSEFSDEYKVKKENIWNRNLL